MTEPLFRLGLADPILKRKMITLLVEAQKTFDRRDGLSPAATFGASYCGAANHTLYEGRVSYRLNGAVWSRSCTVVFCCAESKQNLRIHRSLRKTIYSECIIIYGTKMRILFTTLGVVLAITSSAIAERRPTILDLVEKGYEIKTSTGNYVFLQNEEKIYMCSFLQVSEYNVASGEIDAIKFDCAAVIK